MLRTSRPTDSGEQQAPHRHPRGATSPIRPWEPHDSAGWVFAGIVVLLSCLAWALHISAQQQEFLVHMVSQKAAATTFSGWSSSLAKVRNIGAAAAMVEHHKASLQNLDEKQVEIGSDTTVTLDTPILRTIGKVVFIRPDKTIGWCTGTLAGTNQVVITAAHCLLDTQGRWNSNIAFVYQYGTIEQRLFSATCAVVPVAWGKEGGDELYAHDVGFLQLQEPAPANPLKLATQAKPGKVLKAGYSDQHWNGALVYAQEGIFVRDSPREYRSYKDKFGKGSSGNPWLDEQGDVVSLSSHFHTSHPEQMIGPRLGERARRQMQLAADGCQSP